MVREASSTSSFDIDKITQIRWVRILVEIVSNRCEFVLYVLFDIKQVKSDLYAEMMCVSVRGSAGDGSS